MSIAHSALLPPASFRLRRSQPMRVRSSAFCLWQHFRQSRYEIVATHARQHARKILSTMEHVPQHWSGRFLDMVMALITGSPSISSAGAAAVIADRSHRQFPSNNLKCIVILTARSASFQSQWPRSFSTTATSYNTVTHPLFCSGKETLCCVMCMFQLLM